MLTKEQDYLYERPALTFRKLRKLELAAGAHRRSNPRGRNGKGTPDNPAQWAIAQAQARQTEDHYRAAVADWRPEGPLIL